MIWITMKLFITSLWSLIMLKSVDIMAAGLAADIMAADTTAVDTTEVDITGDSNKLKIKNLLKMRLNDY